MLELYNNVKNAGYDCRLHTFDENNHILDIYFSDDNYSISFGEHPKKEGWLEYEFDRHESGRYSRIVKMIRSGKVKAEEAMKVLRSMEYTLED